MKIKWTVSVLFFVLFQSCDSGKDNLSNKDIYRDAYIGEFKLTYVKQLLLKSYNNASQVKYLINSDYSGFTEPILLDQDYLIIDSLTSIDNRRLVADSIHSIGTVAEGAEGKHPLGYLIYKIESKWLDSLAKTRYDIAKANFQYR